MAHIHAYMVLPYRADHPTGALRPVHAAHPSAAFNHIHVPRCALLTETVYQASKHIASLHTSEQK